MFRPRQTEPRTLPASLALWLGVLSLIPLLAPAAAVLACANAVLSAFLCGRYPEKFTGKGRITAGLLLCALGMLLFGAEATLFFRWKVHQAYDQRTLVSRARLAAAAEGLERCREARGAYPEISGIYALKALLEPGFVLECPALDGFGGALSVESTAEGYRLWCRPPPPPGSSTAPEPMILERHFQPSPPPPVPEPSPEGGEADDGAASPPAGSAPAPSPAPGTPPGGERSGPSPGVTGEQGSSPPSPAPLREVPR